jgi:hypothetical protein
LVSDKYRTLALAFKGGLGKKKKMEELGYI